MLPHYPGKLLFVILKFKTKYLSRDSQFQSLIFKNL